jgi:ribosomal protein L11 methyltransferase
MNDLQTATSEPLSREQAEALVDAVMERDDLALSASAYEDIKTGEWVFEATCAEAPDLDSFSELARLTLGGNVTFSVDRVDPSVDWVARSLEGLRPVAAGGFCVHGGHDAPRSAGLTPILIEAAQAFGTGHHETTSGCLEAIDRLSRQFWFKNPIDIGTGTGVLAIAIAKRMHVKVLATDIDAIAVRTAADNARQNGVGHRIASIEADGLAHPRILNGAPYDLVVANILAAPLMRIAPAVGRVTAPGGMVVLSGLLVTQALRIQLAYARAGMVLVRKLIRGDWATLVLERR